MSGEAVTCSGTGSTTQALQLTAVLDHHCGRDGAGPQPNQLHPGEGDVVGEGDVLTLIRVVTY